MGFAIRKKLLIDLDRATEGSSFFPLHIGMTWGSWASYILYRMCDLL